MKTIKKVLMLGSILFSLVIISFFVSVETIYAQEDPTIKRTEIRPEVVKPEVKPEVVRPEVTPEVRRPVRCCIAGTYEGTFVDDPKCPVGPETGKFIIVINQEDKCGSRIWVDMPTTRLEGTVRPGPGGCCIMRGTARGKPGTEDAGCVHRFEALFCRGADGKWYVEKGTYKSIGRRVCCDGTFSMKQQ